MSYLRFAAMIVASTVAMFGLMYLNTYALDHVFWSETRAWMALVMGSTMAVLMLGFMLRMYPKAGLNLAIFAGAGAVSAISLWLVRSQATVDDEIIASQEREIAEMKALVGELEARPGLDSGPRSRV
jgi:hypothetical protein